MATQSDGEVSWAGWPTPDEHTSRWPVGYTLLFLGRCSCEDTGGPTCFDLITDAVETLSNRDRWPDHTNPRVLAEACSRWATGFFLHRTLDGAPATPRAAPDERLVGGELAFRCWQTMSPIPIGRLALAQAHANGDFPRDASPQRLLNFLPFEGSEWAAYIAWGRFGRTIATVFATAVPEFGDDGRITGFRGGPLAVVVTGDNPNAPGLDAFVEGARRWWSRFTDRKIGPGRPPGPQTRLEDYLGTYLRFCQEQGRRPKSQAEFCETTAISMETMRGHLKAWGVRWSDFQRWDMTGPFPTR